MDALVESKEREMVRRPEPAPRPVERWTSLQPTYEDSVPADPDDDWVFED